MIDFSAAYLKSIVAKEATSITNSVLNQETGLRISPSYLSLLDSAITKYNMFSNQGMSFLDKNLATEPKEISKSSIEDQLSNLFLYSTALTDTLSNVVNDFGTNTYKYIKICQRLLYNNTENANTLNKILNYSCNHINIIKDRETLKSTSFIIGNFITIPFCINNVKLYTGSVYMTATSNEILSFSNLSDISSLPLQTPILLKYQGSNNVTSNIVAVSSAIKKTNLNVVYINGYGPIETVTLDLSLNGTSVFSGTCDGTEGLFNFEPVDVDLIKITLGVSNYNQLKQVSVQIDDILLMGNVKFSKQGVFESKQTSVDHYSGINTINVNGIDYSTNQSVSFDKYISLSFNSENKYFYKLDDGVTAPIPTTKITKTSIFDLTSGNKLNPLLIKSKVMMTNSDIEATFWTKTLEDAMNYKAAQVLIGTNDAYSKKGLTIGAADSNIYENWTKVGNTYKTMILNYEKNIFIDLGLSEIKINNQKRTGMVQIPTGISMVEIHESLMDMTFNGTVDPSNENGIDTDANLYSDPLFPKNFAYLLAGAPQYKNNELDADSNFLLDKVVNGITILQANGPFFPLSVSVKNSKNEDYSLHLGNTPLDPGTFTVEPNSGRIRVHAKPNPDEANEETDIVTVTYTRASINIRPCGILFNRLATYIDYKSICNMMAVLGTYDNTFFSCYVSGANKTLLIPQASGNIPSGQIYHNKILYNMKEDVIYAALKFILKTTSTNLTPMIKNVFIQGIT